MLEVISEYGGLTVLAPAKVNLTLRVLGTRPDGYHVLESVVAGVTLFDTLHAEPDGDLSLACRGLEAPAGPDNLILKAARALGARCGIRAGARLSLEKRIPVGRGLGGGSSDAAATLVALNDLWRCGLDPAELAAVGASVGSDVPLFFGPPMAVMRGRGEDIEPLETRFTWTLVLAWPAYRMPTAEVYAAYDRLGEDGDAKPSATAILEVLGGPVRDAASFLVNDLERAADNMRERRFDVRACLHDAGAQAVGMTGSGSAYFAVADTEAEAQRWADAAGVAGAETYLVALQSEGTDQRENST